MEAETPVPVSPGTATVIDRKVPMGTAFYEEILHNVYDFLLKSRRNTRLYAEVENKYDSNIFRDKEDIQTDLITTYTSGVSYHFKPVPLEGRTEFVTDIELNLNGSMERYATHGNLNRDNLDKNIFGDISLKGVFFDKVTAYFDVHKKQMVASELYPTENTAPTRADRDRLIDYYTNPYGISYDFGNEKQKWSLKYDHTGTEYKNEEDKPDDSNRDVFTIKLYMPTPLDCQFFVEAAYGMVQRYKQKNADSDYKTASTGLTGNFGEKITGTASIGYTMWKSQGGNDSNSAIGSLDFEYQPSPRFTMTLTADHTIQDTNQIADERAAVGEADYVSPREDTNINAEYSNEDKVSVGFSYLPAIDPRLSLHAGAFYSKQIFSDGSEKDTYDADFSANYKIQDWLRIFFSYEHKNEIDDKGAGGYKNNIMTLTIKTEF